MRLIMTTLALAATLTLGGCADDTPIVKQEISKPSDAEGPGPSPSEEPEDIETAEPVRGLLVTTEDLAFVVPEGWENVTDEVKPSNPTVVLAYGAPEEPGAFRTNVNYVATPVMGDFTDEQLERQFRTEIKSLGAEIFELDFMDLDGRNTLRAVSGLDSAQGRIFILQTATLDGGQSHVLTVTSTNRDEAEGIFEDLLDSVEWQ